MNTNNIYTTPSLTLAAQYQFKKKIDQIEKNACAYASLLEEADIPP